MAARKAQWWAERRDLSAEVDEVGDASAARLPRFVASSDVWSFAVEVRCEGARSAWWVTYGRASGGWRVLQRVRVVE